MSFATLSRSSNFAYFTEGTNYADFRSLRIKGMRNKLLLGETGPCVLTVGQCGFSFHQTRNLTWGLNTYSTSYHLKPDNPTKNIWLIFTYLRKLMSGTGSPLKFLFVHFWIIRVCINYLSLMIPKWSWKTHFSFLPVHICTGSMIKNVHFTLTKVAGPRNKVVWQNQPKV